MRSHLLFAPLLLLLASLGAAEEKRCAWGVYDPLPAEALAHAKTFENATGLETLLVACHADFSERFPAEFCGHVWASKRLPLIKWDFRNSGTARLRSLIGGELDFYLRLWADEAARFGEPVLIEPFRQFNRSQMPWSTANQQQNSAQVAGAFRRIVEIFRDRGANNVRWVWCPHVFPTPPSGWNDIEDAFPGNNFIDFVALEGFELHHPTAFDLSLTFEQMFGFPIRKLKGIAGRKPILLTDVPIPKTDAERDKWMQSWFAPLVAPGSAVKAVIFTPSERSETDLHGLQKVARDSREPLTAQEFIKRPFWPFQWFGAGAAVQLPYLPIWKAAYLAETPVSSLSTALTPAPALHLAFPGVTLAGLDLSKNEIFSGQIRFAWNATHLFFWCEVNDATVGESYVEPAKIWDGDHLELGLGATSSPESIDLAHCVRIQISPGNASHIQPSTAWISGATGGLKSKPDGVEVRSQFGVDGKSYRVFGSIAWQVLDFSPKESDRIRLNVTLTDGSGGHRARQLIWAGGVHAYHDPTEWGYLELQASE